MIATIMCSNFGSKWYSPPLISLEMSYNHSNCSPAIDQDWKQLQKDKKSPKKCTEPDGKRGNESESIKFAEGRIDL